jgi:lysylphosphatidylglycerol synthetase-like protein (DUF2156 family)
MSRSRRVWLAVCAVLLAGGLVAFAWRMGPELLLFGGIVAVAAWGFGRHTRVKSRVETVASAAVDDVPVAKEEHVA